MVAGLDVSPPLTALEGGTSMEPSTEVENIGKPPRNISVIRHCMSSARLAEVVSLHFSHYMLMLSCVHIVKLFYIEYLD